MALNRNAIDGNPTSGLDDLESRHRAEERREAERDLVSRPRPLALRLPAGGALPESEAWLARLYDAGIVREKKPAVFDHLRSFGPWFVSVDETPLSVLDGMSQTATMPAGFATDPVVAAFFEGAFGTTPLANPDTTAEASAEARAFAEVIRRLVPGLPEVTFANGGSEANEKALALCRTEAPTSATKVLAFEGGFHGRTLLPLHATANPAKRGPYELKGYEATFVPFPVWTRPKDREPAEPDGFLDAVAEGRLDALLKRYGDGSPGGAEADPALLGSEIESLVAVDRALSTGDYLACIVEPMQSEGGDRYASGRFFRALRLLTRRHRVALVFDEVQTGFGLGGPFAWHSRFGLADRDGNPDHPDAVVFAKRAQVGIVASRFVDPEPTPTQAASLIRGRIHAEMCSLPGNAEIVQALVRPRLDRLAERWPKLVTAPRCRGFAVAFDLPSPEHLKAYIAQRFYRGAVVFAAGSRTARYRLNASWDEAEVDALFVAIHESLAFLEAHPGETPPAWEDPPARAGIRSGPETRVRLLEKGERAAACQVLVDLEARVFEPARQDPPARLKEAIEHPEGVPVVAEVKDGGAWRMIGFAVGIPLELAGDVPGPAADPMLGRENTLYSRTVTLDPDYHGLGLGHALKMAQLEAAMAMNKPDGSPRYRFSSGRNRVGLTPAMRRLNRRFGAHLVTVLHGQYDRPDGVAIYYRIPLGPPAPGVESAPVPAAAGRAPPLDLASGITRPFAAPPEDLRDAAAEGRLYGPTVNKITLCNYVTPAIVRAVEWAHALIPSHPHLFLTSSRDEATDKSLRILRYHRPGGQVAIGVAGGYYGHTTAAARSLSDPSVHAQGAPWFDFPRVPHPAVAGVDGTIAAIGKAVDAAGGTDAVLGLYLEAVQERTGRTIPGGFWPALSALRDALGIPVVVMETASACYRSGRGPFAGTGDFVPDVVGWWGGSQTGYLHVSDSLFVDKPLTMVSTWDGDELSLLREHHQLRAARRLDLSPLVEALDRALKPAADAGLEVRGLGLYRVVDAVERAEELAVALDGLGVHLRRFPGGCLAVIPPLDATPADLARLHDALEEVL